MASMKRLGSVVVLFVAACYQPDPYTPLPDATRPDAAIHHDAPPIIDPDATIVPPDAATPDAPPDAAPPPAVCGDGVRAPGELCFGTPIVVAAGELVYSARLADLDGDGKRDLVYLTQNNVVIRKGDGAGGFAAAALGPATNSWWLATGDLDGDGIADLAATGRQQVTVWFGQGGGAFGTAHTITLGDGPVGIAVADVDGYPGDELIVTTAHYFTIWTWFVGELDQLYSSGGSDNVAQATADINGDGRADSLVVDSSYFDRFLGGVDGVSTYGDVSNDDAGSDIAIANVDSDPAVDAVTAVASPPSIAIYTRADISPDYSTTHRRASQSWPVGSGTPRFVAATDLDGGGVAEVVAGLPDTAQLLVFRDDGTVGKTIALAEPMTSVRADGDANGDGIAEIVATLTDQIVVVPSAAP
jgi:hypothetical protein